MKKIVLPAIAATVALGAAAGIASQGQDIEMKPSAPPVASNTSADYQNMLARSGGIVSALTHIIVKNQSADQTTFDK